MYPTFDDKVSQEANSAEAIDMSASRLPWVKPALESLSLKDALNTNGAATDGGVGSS